MKHNLVIVDVFKEIAAAMKVPDLSDTQGGFYSIFYNAGKDIQILHLLADKDNSEWQKSSKYPMLALFLPIRESRSDKGWYSNTVIPRLLFAMNTSSTDTVLDRYLPGGTFKSTLYPCYNEFLRQLALHRNIVGNDQEAFTHRKMDNPGIQPIGQGINDYVDCIEILDLELKFIQTKTC